MARRGRPKKAKQLKPYYVEGMTVNNILNISPEVLDTLNKRDISRALRTVALAANKRIKNLMNAAKASSKTAIAQDALNWLKDTVKGKFGKSLNRGFKFGVKSASTRSSMIQQLTVLRNFFNLKTSTVKGAKSARQARDIAIYGQTREDMTKGMSKREKAKFMSMLNKYDKRIWTIYKNYCETQGRDPHEQYDDSGSVLRTISEIVQSGGSDQDALDALLGKTEQQQMQEQDEINALEAAFNEKHIGV